MMAKAAIQANILNNGSNLTVAPNATVSIKVASTGSNATLWEDRAGATGKSNPFTADANGFFRVYADPGRYDITVTTSSGTQTFEDVVVFPGSLRIDDSGNVGIGATTPGNPLHILKPGGATPLVRLQASDAADAIAQIGNPGSNWYYGADQSNSSAFLLSLNNADLSTGYFLAVNTSGFTRLANDSLANNVTGTYHEMSTNQVAANRVCYIWHKATSGNNLLLEFATESGTSASRGGIAYNRGSSILQYNTTSDGTLKTIVGDADSDKSLQIIKDYAAACKDYYWNHDKSKKIQIGPIAQELHKVFPGAVSVGGEYEEDENGKKVTKYRPWAVDKTAAVNHLVITVAKQQQQIEQQQSLIESLEKRLEKLEAQSVGN